MPSNNRNQGKQHKDATHLLYGHPWVHSLQTNVQETWRRFGWQPVHPAPATGVESTYQKKGK